VTKPFTPDTPSYVLQSLNILTAGKWCLVDGVVPYLVFPKTVGKIKWNDHWSVYPQGHGGACKHFDILLIHKCAQEIWLPSLSV
jgi:hypothetical protein